MTGEEALLAVAIGAPAAGALAALLFGSSPLARRFVQVAALVSAGAWAGLLGISSTVRLGALHTGPLVASACSGAALLLISACSRREAGLEAGPSGREREAGPDGREREASRWPLVASGLSLVSLQVGLASGGEGGHGGALVGGLAAAALLSVSASWDPRRLTGLIAMSAAAIGVGATAVGVVLVHDKTSEWLLPSVGAATLPRSAVVALIGGAAALCVAGGLRPGRSTVLLLAGGLGLGLRAAPLLGLPNNLAPAAPGAAEGLAGLALALGVLAVVAALLRKPPLAIAMLALAVAAGPLRLMPASRLLAAASVLALAIDHAPASSSWPLRPAWILVVPGAAALVSGAIDAGSALALVCVATVATVCAVAAGVGYFDGARPEDVRRRRFDLLEVPAVLAGVWLVLAPSRWSWVAAQELHYYDIGAARALAAGLIAAVAVVAWSNRPERGEPKRPPDPQVEPLHPGQTEDEAPELVPSERSAP